MLTNNSHVSGFSSFLFSAFCFVFFLFAFVAVFAVAVAVIALVVVALAFAAAGEQVQDHAGDRGVDVALPLNGLGHGYAGGLAAIHQDDDGADFRGHQQRIFDGVKRRGVNDHPVIIVQSLFKYLFEQPLG